VAKGGGGLVERRRRGSDAFVRETLERRYGSHGLECLGGILGLQERLRDDAGASPFASILTLGREIEESLARPQT